MDICFSTIARLVIFVGIICGLSYCSNSSGGFLEVPETFCNPMNLDYAFIPTTHKYYGIDQSHRSTADPAVVRLRDTLYLFSTNQNGYWWSPDMREWHFIRQDFKDNGPAGDNVCAPGAWTWGDTLVFLPSFTSSSEMPLYFTTDPIHAKWQVLTDSFRVDTWDPSLFKDDDGRMYAYWGSSNTFPLYGVELNPSKKYEPIGEPTELVRLHPESHGWERFGQDNLDSITTPYIEGAWMTKFDKKYYLQYAAPGTEWNVYADGVLVGEKPLGPFEYQNYSPFSFKPGGFITGAGHGSTFQDKYGNYFHVASMLDWIKYKFERRLGIFPAGFDQDGELYCITAFGDYPQYHANGPRNHLTSAFTGWMLLSYHKKCWASSSLRDKQPDLAFNENIRDYWSAASSDPGEFLAVDLGKVYDVYALQVNYADQDAHLRDKQSDIYHQYIVYCSDDLENWEVLVDKRKNTTDIPHDYVQLKHPVKTRYLKIENVHMADGKFAIGDLRIFGKSQESRPGNVTGFIARRGSDTRNARFSWDKITNAYAYNIRYGISPDKLYNCLMVYDSAFRDFRGLNKDITYYANITAVGESGESDGSEIVKF